MNCTWHDILWKIVGYVGTYAVEIFLEKFKQTDEVKKFHFSWIIMYFYNYINTVLLIWISNIEVEYRLTYTICLFASAFVDSTYQREGKEVKNKIAAY